MQYLQWDQQRHALQDWQGTCNQTPLWKQSPSMPALVRGPSVALKEDYTLGM